MEPRIGWHQVFEELKPPPGGLAALRARLDRAETEIPWSRQQLVGRWAVVAAACALTLLLVPLLWHEPSTTWRDAVLEDGNPALVRLGLAEPAADVVSVPAGRRRMMAVEKVELGDPAVLYYRVAVLPGS